MTICYLGMKYVYQVLASIITFAVDVHPDNRRTNERPMYHAACKDEYRL